MSLTLRTATGATDTTLDISGADALAEGDLRDIGSETVLVRSAITPALAYGEAARQLVTVYRGVDGTTKAGHAAGTSVAAHSGGGGGGVTVTQSWLQTAIFSVASGAYSAIPLTTVIPGGGPGYTDGPDELGLASQLPSDYPLLEAGTYMVFAHLTCGNAAVSTAVGALLFQPRAVVASAITDDGVTLKLPVPAAATARMSAHAGFIISDQDVLDEDNGLVISVGNYSDTDLGSMLATVVIQKLA